MPACSPSPDRHTTLNHLNIDCFKSQHRCFHRPLFFNAFSLPGQFQRAGKHEIKVKEAAFGFKALLDFSFHAQVPLPVDPVMWVSIILFLYTSFRRRWN